MRRPEFVASGAQGDLVTASAFHRLSLAAGQTGFVRSPAKQEGSHFPISAKL